MAQPIFEKTGATTVVLTDAFDLESGSPIDPRQTFQRSYNKRYKVISRGSEDQIFNLIASEMLQSDVDNLLTFFRSEVVNYGEKPFLYTDHLSVQRQVRYLDSDLPGIPVGPGVARLSMTLVVDNGALD